MLVSANTRGRFLAHYLVLFALAALARLRQFAAAGKQSTGGSGFHAALCSAAPSAAAQGEKLLSDVDAQAFAKSLEATFKSGDRGGNRRRLRLRRNFLTAPCVASTIKSDRN